MPYFQSKFSSLPALCIKLSWHTHTLLPPDIRGGGQQLRCTVWPEKHKLFTIQSFTASHILFQKAIIKDPQPAVTLGKTTVYSFTVRVKPLTVFAIRFFSRCACNLVCFFRYSYPGTHLGSLLVISHVQLLESTQDSPHSASQNKFFDSHYYIFTHEIQMSAISSVQTMYGSRSVSTIGM